MCHVILLMPVLALPLFWVLPPGAAVPVYIAISSASGLLYWRIVSSHRRQPQAGAESLIGTGAEVVSRLAPVGPAQYLVRSRGELWSATSPDILQAGDPVRVTAVDGIKLVVARNGHEGDEAILSEPTRRRQGEHEGHHH